MGSTLLYKRWVMPQERDLVLVSFIKTLGEGQRTSIQLYTVLFLAGQTNDWAGGVLTSVPIVSTKETYSFSDDANLILLSYESGDSREPLRPS